MNSYRNFMIVAKYLFIFHVFILCVITSAAQTTKQPQSGKFRQKGDSLFWQADADGKTQLSSATFKPFSPETVGTIIYDNSIISGHWYHPGANREVLDWGTSSGGTIIKFTFRYITKQLNPGQIVIRFYEGAKSTICPGNLLAEYKLNGLNGSPDGGDYTFAHDFIIPNSKEFDLPAGTFGYSFEFENDQTGVELAWGGGGNENIVWECCTGPHHCSDPNIWAGFYMQVYAFEESKGSIRIEPLLLDFNCEGPNKGINTKQSNGNFTGQTKKVLINTLRYRKKYNGKGVALAICDTGIDYNHPQMGGGGFPNKKVIGGWDFGNNDADPNPNGLMHGTFCAGVAAGNIINAQEYTGGIAYNAKLYALKIKGQLTHQANFDTLVAALNWCVKHQYDDPYHPILVVSISYGGKRSFTTCDGLVPELTTAVNKALAAGITVLAASGNDSWVDSIQCPACISGIISVGAINHVFLPHTSSEIENASTIIYSSNKKITMSHVVDNTTADAVIPFSNTSLFLDILAASNWNYTSNTFQTEKKTIKDFGETSSACAYAAGVVACLQSAAKDMLGRYLMPYEIREILIETGDYITDSRVDIIKPQINIDRAIDNLVCDGKAFWVYNDGPGLLRISAITTEKNSGWLSFWPAAPFAISPGGHQKICVEVDGDSCWLSNKLLVFSDDPSDNPVAVSVNIMPHTDVNEMDLSRSIILLRSWLAEDLGSVLIP